MPGAVLLSDEAEDAAVLLDEIMGADFRLPVAEAVQRFFSGLHASVVEDDRIDGASAPVEIRRWPLDRLHGFCSGSG